MSRAPVSWTRRLGQSATIPAVCAAACYALIYRLPALASLGALRNLAATLAGTAICAWAARSWLLPSDRPRRAPLLLLLGITAALRLAIPLQASVGSDDAYRYVFDGRVQLAGHNPYRFPPQAEQLADLRDRAIYPHIFRRDLRTVYPPLAQSWFAVAAMIDDDGLSGLKLVYLLHELITVWLLVVLARRHRRRPLAAVIYAWSPLAVVQLFAGAHLDGLLIPHLLAALLLAEHSPLGSGIALGLAALVRPWVALCGPALALRRPPRETVIAGAGALLSVAALSGPYLDAGARIVESMLVYGEHWQFNGSIYRALELLMEDKASFRLALHATIGALALGAGILPLGRTPRAAIGLGLYFALAPTVYPWYALPLVALLALELPLSAIALPALLGLSDLVAVDGVVGGRWQVPPLALAVEYAGIYGVVLFELWRRKRRAPQQDDRGSAAA